MKKLTASLAGLVLGLSLTANVWACNTSEGELYSMNADKSEMVMKLSGCGTEKSFTLKKETKITLNGKEVALGDLKSGDKIKIDYESATDVLKIDATRAS